MYVSALKLVTIHIELLNKLAGHVTVLRDVNYKGWIQYKCKMKL